MIDHKLTIKTESSTNMPRSMLCSLTRTVHNETQESVICLAYTLPYVGIHHLAKGDIYDEIYHRLQRASTTGSIEEVFEDQGLRSGTKPTVYWVAVIPVC